MDRCHFVLVESDVASILLVSITRYFFFGEKMKLYLVLIFYLCEVSLLVCSGSVFGTDQSGLDCFFVKLNSNFSKFDRILNIGDISISGPFTASRSLNNKNYLVTYHTFDSLGVPHYFLLNIDISQKAKVIENVTLNGPGVGSFFKIVEDEKQGLIGIRESLHPGSTLEVASINRTNGLMKSIGFYPYGEYSLVMTFARQRRLFYNLIDSYRFCAIDVDTGRLDVDTMIPGEYLIYAIVYDSIKDRLLTIVTIENSWVLAEMKIENSSSTISFQRIGNSSIPMSKGYLWTNTYTLALTQRQLMTLWDFSNEDTYILITFDIDSGDIIQKQTISNANYLNNLVYFD